MLRAELFFLANLRLSATVVSFEPLINEISPVIFGLNVLRRPLCFPFGVMTVVLEKLVENYNFDLAAVL